MIPVNVAVNRNVQMNHNDKDQSKPLKDDLKITEDNRNKTVVSIDKSVKPKTIL